MPNIFDPQVAQPTGGFSPVAAPPPDMSVGKAIGALAGFAEEAYKQYDMSRLVGPSSEKGNLTVETYNPATGEKELIPVTEGLNLRKIARAREQGMNAMEAEILASAAVKEAINRNPGYAESYRREFENFFRRPGGEGYSYLEATSPEKQAAKNAQDKEDQEARQTITMFGSDNPTNRASMKTFTTAKAVTENVENMLKDEKLTQEQKARLVETVSSAALVSNMVDVSRVVEEGSKLGETAFGLTMSKITASLTNSKLNNVVAATKAGLIGKEKEDFIKRLDAPYDAALESLKYMKTLQPMKDMFSLKAAQFEDVVSTSYQQNYSLYMFNKLGLTNSPLMQMYIDSPELLKNKSPSLYTAVSAAMQTPLSMDAVTKVVEGKASFSSLNEVNPEWGMLAKETLKDNVSSVLAKGFPQDPAQQENAKKAFTTYFRDIYKDISPENREGLSELQSFLRKPGFSSAVKQLSKEQQDSILSPINKVITAAITTPVVGLYDRLKGVKGVVLRPADRYSPIGIPSSASKDQIALAARYNHTIQSMYTLQESGFNITDEQIQSYTKGIPIFNPYPQEAK